MAIPPELHHDPDPKPKKPTPAKKKPTPKKAPTIKAVLTEIVINYSVGVKANIGNYESADAHLSKTEKWNVTGMTLVAATKFYEERRAAIKAILDVQIEQEYMELLGQKKNDPKGEY